MISSHYKQLLACSLILIFISGSYNSFAGSGSSTSDYFTIDTLNSFEGSMASSQSGCFLLDTRGSSPPPPLEVLTVGNIAVWAASIEDLGNGVYRASGYTSIGNRDLSPPCISTASASMIIDTTAESITSVNWRNPSFLGSGAIQSTLGISAPFLVEPVCEEDPAKARVATGGNLILPNGMEFSGSFELDPSTCRFLIEGQFQEPFNGLESVSSELFVNDAGYQSETVVQSVGSNFGQVPLGSYGLLKEGTYELKIQPTQCLMNIRQGPAQQVEFFDGMEGFSVGFGAGPSPSANLELEWDEESFTLSGNDLVLDFENRSKTILWTRQPPADDFHAATLALYIPRTGEYPSGTVENLSCALSLASFSMEINNIHASLEWPLFNIEPGFQAHLGSTLEADGVGATSILDFENEKILLGLQGSTTVEETAHGISQALAGKRFQASAALNRGTPLEETIGLRGKEHIQIFGCEVDLTDKVLTLKDDRVYSCEPFQDLENYPLGYSTPSAASEYKDWNQSNTWDSGINIDFLSEWQNCEFVLTDQALRGRLPAPFWWENWKFGSDTEICITESGERSWCGLILECSNPTDPVQAAQVGQFATVFQDSYERATVLLQDEDEPPLILTGPSVSYLADTRAVITWETNEPCRSRIDYEANAVHDFVSSGSSFSMFHSLRLENLTPNNQYTFQVSSTDLTGGNQVVSQEQIFTTQNESDSEAPVLISTPTGSALTRTAVAISWLTDEAASARIEYGTDGAFDHRVSLPKYKKQHDAVLQHLAPETEYNFRVLCSDPSGNGPAISDVLSFSTTKPQDNQDPIILFGPEVTEQSTTSAQIYWDTDEVADSIIDFGETLNYGKQVVLGKDEPGHEVLLNFLVPGQVYHYRVGSIDPEGNGPVYSADGIFTVGVTPTYTPTTTQTPSFTATPTLSPTVTETLTPIPTETATQTATTTATETSIPTFTETPLDSPTATQTFTTTATATATATETSSPSATATTTPTPSPGEWKDREILFQMSKDWKLSGYTGPCDVDGNQEVDAKDLLQLIQSW